MDTFSGNIYRANKYIPYNDYCFHTMLSDYVELTRSLLDLCVCVCVCLGVPTGVHACSCVHVRVHVRKST